MEGPSGSRKYEAVLEASKGGSRDESLSLECMACIRALRRTCPEVYKVHVYVYLPGYPAVMLCILSFLIRKFWWRRQNDH